MRSKMMVSVLLAGLCALVGGCNLVAGASYLVTGPEKMRKEYDLARERPTVVFVDDLNSVLDRRSLRRAIAEQAQTELLSKRTLENVIDAQAALAVSARDRQGTPLSVVDVGRAVEAEVVIHVSIDAFTLSPDGAAYSPTAIVRVRVTDAKADRRLWPTEPNGYPMQVTMPSQTKTLPALGTSEHIEAENALARKLGSAVAELFYNVERQDSSRTVKN